MWYIDKAPLRTALLRFWKIEKFLKKSKKSVDKVSKMWYSIKVAADAAL